MRTVVVGVAATERDDPVLVVAVQEAVRRRLPLIVVHALGVPFFGDLRPGLATGWHGASGGVAEVAIRAALARATVQVPGGVTVRASVHLAEQEAVPALLAEAATAALLVVGTHTTGTWSRTLLGSVSTGCVHRASCPVMVVPGGVAPQTRRIVVGVDGGSASLSALAWGVAQAAERALPLVALGVCPASHVIPSALEAVHRDPSRALRVLLQQAGGTGLPADVVVRVGDAADEILSEVGEHDLLVVGNRGHGSLVTLVLGSTSTRLVHRAGCLTVVVRAGQARRELHRQPGLRRLAPVGPAGHVT